MTGQGRTMNEPALPILEDHWRRSFAALGLRAPKDVFDGLLVRYREPHRAYHTLQHIGECIDHMNAVRNPPAELGLAIWFHDAIYDPRASDNEARSAAWAGAVLDKAASRTKVERMILATQHTALPDDEASRLLVDIDLAILGVAEPRFSEYEAQIRREYAWLDEETYRPGRLKLLQAFSDRPFIYGTTEFRSRFEPRARRNLERSINALIQVRR